MNTQTQSRPGRTPGSKNKNTLDYIHLYEKLVLKYGCPVEALFRMATMKRGDKVTRIAAAKALLPYRFSKRASEMDDGQVQGELTLVWDSDAITPELEAEANADG